MYRSINPNTSLGNTENGVVLVYNTVSSDELMVIGGCMPVDLYVRKRTEEYRLRKEDRFNNTSNSKILEQMIVEWKKRWN